MVQHVVKVKDQIVGQNNIRHTNLLLVQLLLSHYFPVMMMSTHQEQDVPWLLQGEIALIVKSIGQQKRSS